VILPEIVSHESSNPAPDFSPGGEIPVRLSNHASF